MARPPKEMHPRTKVRVSRLPFGPLYEELKSYGLVTSRQVAEFYGVTRHTVKQWCVLGMGTYTADKLAVRIKLLPYVVWGDAFFDGDLMDSETGANGGARHAFTDSDVREIRARHAAGESAYKIARDYPVSAESVRQVAVGQSYGYVA